MWQYNNTDELYHYGVLGMKWGHRKNYIQAIRTARKARRTRDEKISDRLDKYDEKAHPGAKVYKFNSADKKVYDKAIKEYNASKAQYKKDKKKAKEAYKSNIKNLKNTHGYKVHRQKIRTVGKGVAKTILQNAALGAAGGVAVGHLVSRGKMASAMAIGGLTAASGYANAARNIINTRKKYRNIK